MFKKAILKAITDILIHDVLGQNYNMITFTKLGDLLRQKHHLQLAPSDIDLYLEELGLLCFAMNLPLLNALVVGTNYMPSPRFYKLYQELYRTTQEHPRQVHETEVRRVMDVTDWTTLYHRLSETIDTPFQTSEQTSPRPIPEADYLKQLEERVIAAMENGMLSRRERLANAPQRPQKIMVTKTVYDVNPDVIAEVLIRANGFCENCGRMAPFRRQKDNRPYLKIYYKTPFEQGGLDTVDNAMAVCPNCYEKLQDR